VIRPSGRDRAGVKVVVRAGDWTFISRDLTIKSKVYVFTKAGTHQSNS
jgi:hypothetical protein